jgi:hypothetical protein
MSLRSAFSYFDRRRLATARSDAYSKSVRVIFVWILFLLLSGVALPAEELLQTAQRELRARKFYFGEIDGRASAETVTAIENFQLAKGIDKTGQLTDETVRALGLPAAVRGNREDARVLEECCTRVLRYLQAWQSGNWEREAPYFADEVNYYFDQKVSRDFIREMRARENRRWPQRKSTMLQRIASLLPDRNDRAQVTARVRTEVGGPAGPAQARTEDLIFRLQMADGSWRITELKLLE